MFTVGNIVVLILVLIILFIIRSIDAKRVRSDAIKKRFDETVAQFNAIVGEQKDELKSLKLAITSEQKTTVSLLERSKKLNQSVYDQEPKLNTLHERMAEFNQLLPQLMSMTELAQKNIDNIQKESEYIDGVGKRIKGTQESIKAVEKELDQIHAGFEGASQRQLQEVEARVLAASETRGAQLLETISESVEHANAVLEDVTVHVASIEEKESALREFSDNLLTRTAESIDQLVEKNISEVDQKLDEKVQQVLGKHGSDLDVLDQKVSKKLSEFDELAHTYGASLDKNQGELKAVEASVAEHISRMHTSANDFQQRLSSIASDKEASFMQSIQNMQLDYGKLVAETRAELQNFERATLGRIDAFTKDAETSITKIHQNISEETNEIEQHCAGVLDDARTKLEGLHNQVTSLEHAAMQAIQSHIDTEVQNVQQDNEAVIQELRSIVVQLRSEKDVLQETVDKEIETLHEFFTTKQESARVKLTEKLEIIVAQIERGIEDKSSELFQLLTRKILDQKEAVEKNYADLKEEVSATREQAGEWKAELEGEYTRMQGHIDGSKERIQENEKSVHVQFENLEARAETILNALSDFEVKLDEKQSDLLAASKKNIDKEFLVLTESLDEKLRVSEGTLLEQLKNDVTTIEEELRFRLKRLESIPDQVTVFENRLKESVRDTYDTVHAELKDQRSRFESKQDELFGSLNDLQKHLTAALNEQATTLDSKNRDMETRFTRVQEDFTEKLMGLESDCSAKLGENEKQMQELIETRSSALFAMIQNNAQEMEKSLEEETRSEYQKTKSEILQAIDEVTRELTELRARGDALITESSEQTEQYKVQFQELVAQLNKDLQDTLYQEFAAKQQEWRGQFNGQLQTITDNLIEQEKAYLERFTILQNELLQIEQKVENQSLQVTRSQSEFFDSFDAKKTSYSEELIAIMQGTRDQFVDIRTRLIEQFSIESSALEKQLDKIEKKHNNFVDQTKLFDRIEQNTNELKKISVNVQSDINNLRQERKWIHELELHIQKTKKNARDTEQQLAKFLGEKRRIDQLEKEFHSLMQQSRAIELKMQDLVAHTDDIDKIQLMLRNLKGIENEVEERSKRLIEKKELIDTTIDGAQSGFSQLQRLEEQIQQYNEKLIAVPTQINDMQRELEQIESKQGSLEDLAEQSNKIDTVLHEAEERVEKLEKAREWLAREETRYNEIRRQIQDQLQSLNQLVQADLGEIHKEAGAPGKTSRKTVIQLSKQGWSADEIARVTKLSKGEVELILEMATESIT